MHLKKNHKAMSAVARILAFFVLAAMSLPAAEDDPKILGLRVYANNDEYQPPIITQPGAVTIELDVATPQPPDLRVIFVHASRDWVPESRMLLTDKYHSTSRSLDYLRAPQGVAGYTFRYKNSFPDQNGIITFPYSGNYIFSIVDHQDESRVLAQGRFILAEQLVSTSIKVENKYYPETSNPWNQRHAISVTVNAAGLETAVGERFVNHINITRVDVIQNWKLRQPYHIDVNHADPDVFVDNFYLPEKCFRIRSVLPGNEYRRLDIGSPRLYPNYQTVRLLSGYDASRVQWQGSMDANGAAKLRPFTGTNSDYLDVVFRLRLITPPEKQIFVVGAFNNWFPRAEDELIFDNAAKEYSVKVSMRRGVYDYQYVTGEWNDATGELDDADWYELEGNDWRTIERYTALAYYRDERFGGLDRVIGVATGKSPGGMDETKEEIK